MESKTENRKWKNAGRFPAELLFMTGFFAGNVLPNLIWKMEWKQKTLASFYLIRSFAGKDISGGAYFLEVLRRRGGFFLLLFLCGFTIFGVPLTVAYMLFLGMETGMILALSVLEFGIYGGVAGAGLLMPQYLVSVSYTHLYKRQIWSIFRRIFILQVSYTDNRMGSGKIMDLCRRKQGLIFGRGSQFFCCIQEESSQKVF